MPETLKFDLVTPGSTLFSDAVEMVTVPLVDGELYLRGFKYLYSIGGK